MALDIIARGMAGAAQGEISALSTKYEASYGTLFSFKGTIATVSDLPKTGNTLGDVYYVSTDSEDGTKGEYVWQYNSETNTASWEYMGDIIDLSMYATKEEIEEALANYQEKLEFDDTPTEGSKNPVTSEGIKAYVDSMGGEAPIVSISADGEKLVPDKDKNVDLPLATQLRAGLVKLGTEFNVDEDGNLVLAKNEDGTWNIPDGSIGINKISIPEGTTLILEDELQENEP